MMSHKLLLLIVLAGINGMRLYGGMPGANPIMNGESEWRGLGEECSEAPKISGDRRKNKDFLTVATFNSEWLFMDDCPSTGCVWKSNKEAEEHMKQVAKTIYKLDADIVNVLEVESCRTLARMLAFMPPGHGYRPYVVRSADDCTGQTLGMLTRVDPVKSLERSLAKVSFPVKNTKCPPAGVSGKTGSTKHYVTRFEVKNSVGKVTSFVMAGAHLLSQPQDLKRCSRREGQAVVVREAVERARRPSDKIIILGDLNDTDNWVQTPSGAKSISGVLPILRSTGGNWLQSVADKLSFADRFSAWWDANGNCKDDGGKEHTLIDHILVSNDWNIESAFTDHSYTVSCSRRVSDHWPLAVTLKL